MERSCQAQLLAEAAGTPVLIDAPHARAHGHPGRLPHRRATSRSSRSTPRSPASSPTSSTERRERGSWVGSPAVTLDPTSVLLTDRVAIVTGAAVGIGEAIALAFARFGADVAICDRDVEHLDRTADADRGHRPPGRRRRARRPRRRCRARLRRGGGGAAREGRHPGEQRRRRLLRRVPRRERQGPGRADPRELHQRHELHPGGGAAGCPATGGSIINITSIEAHRAGPNYAVYSAMKAGVFSLSKSLALELGDRLIRVNCIAPDVIPTPGIASNGAAGRPHAAADRGPRRRHRRRGRLPRERPEPVRHRHHRARRRRQHRGRRVDPGRPGRLEDVVKYGIALGAANAKFFVDIAVEAERSGSSRSGFPST